jgi:hypothetical protein
MSRAAYVIAGLSVLSLVTFMNPMEGNLWGFCPPSEGPKAIGVDAVVAAIDAIALWLIYRGFRA